MIIKKSKVFRYCSYGYLVLWTFIFIAGICSRIVDIETSKEKIIFSIVMSVILIPIVLCSLHYSLFFSSFTKWFWKSNPLDQWN